MDEEVESTSWLSGLLEQTDRLVLAIGGYDSSEGMKIMCILPSIKVKVERSRSVDT